jgi:GT2 family glycosyltransferase
MVAAERQARHLPRAWVTYEDLLATPAAQIAGIARDLGIPLFDRAPNGLAAATEFLTGTLNRAVKVPETDLAPPLLALTETVWAAIQTRDSDPALWDGFAAQVAMFVGLLAEFGASRGPIVPGLIAAPPAALTAEPEKTSLRPAERLDEGARRRLLARAATGKLPRFGVIIAAPPRRAHAITETLESLRQQWRDFDDIGIVSADPIAFPGITTIPAAADAGAVTARLCEALNAADNVDYVAVINAGDILAPDACLRFALTAAETDADLIYCDEIVPNDQGGWVRHKPGWDVTRLRQSAYLGDWVCYRAAALRRLGGFDAAFAGAEEYDVQLRFAETGAQVVRLPEALFTRAVLSRRDNIPATEFGPRALAALAAHLSRAGIPGTARPRNYLGLFRHDHDAPDPGTATILLCDHAGIADLDRWMQALLGAGPTSGRIILAGANLTPPTYAYLAQVAAQAETLGALVAAVPPSPGLIPAAALRAALALADTEHVIILDAASAPPAPGWADALRARLADPCVAVVGARALIPLAQDPNRLVVQGPIIPGADIRLGAGHFADDPGPGGWLAVDAQASAVAPALLARRTAFAACTIPDLSGDALWIDLCARIRAAGGRIVWTPDVSFIVPAAAIQPDPDCRFRAGAHAAHAVPAADPYHHPALSLHGNLLGPEPRLGLIRATPADPDDVLLSGPAAAGMAVLNAARALRGAGLIEASWAPEPFLPAELARRAPAAWVRINPDSPAASPYTAVFTTAPSAPALPAITAAKRLVATSPALAASLRKLAPARHPTLWRPALSGPLWTTLRPASGLNTKPRVLWIDEGIAPAWLPDLINDTRAIAAWIVVERPGVQYSGDIARLRAPDDEQGWARELGALAPHILLRPADVDAAADHYTLLLGAAAGCHALVDDRLDAPPSLGATALPNRLDAWRDALTQAITDFAGTYDRGRRARLACLALPSVEAAPPPWAERPMTMATLVARSAAD